MSEFGRIEITGSKRAGFPEIREGSSMHKNGWDQRTTARRLDIHTLACAARRGEKEFVLRQQARPDSQKSGTEDSLLLRLLRIQFKYIHQGLTALLDPFWVIGLVDASERKRGEPMVTKRKPEANQKVIPESQRRSIKINTAQGT